MPNNRQLADTFTLIANLLEIKGEIIYKTLAYHKAAESLVSLPREAVEDHAHAGANVRGATVIIKAR